MARKPTHKELGQRVKQLEKEVAKQKDAENALRESENKYRQVFATISDVIMIFDAETRQFIDVNDAVLRVYGYTREEFLKLRHPDITAEIEESDSSIKQTLAGKLNRIPVRYHKKKDGTVFPVEISASTFTLRERNVLCGVVKDISERKQAEEALQESEEKLDAMLGSIGDHMSMMDKDLNIIWANETAKRLFGNDIIGKKCFRTYHRRKKPCEPYPCLTLRAFQDGKTHEHYTRVIDKEGRIIHFHCTANVALRDREGKPTAVIEISRDITEQKRGEEALRKREAELKTQSHHLEEVNTALRVLLKQREEDKKNLEKEVFANVKQLIIPHLHRLRKSRPNANQRILISTIESNLDKIVSPLASQLSAGFLGLTPTEIQVADLVKEGKTNKEIGQTLFLSLNTVKFHRHNLRSKLGLRNKKLNLRTHLLSLIK